MILLLESVESFLISLIKTWETFCKKLASYCIKENIFYCDLLLVCSFDKHLLQFIISKGFNLISGDHFDIETGELSDLIKLSQIHHYHYVCLL